uniref:Winged helix Storkhead-box1 domain-containing protein n=1 Tax=Glossina pallidipes TaxID=7398 RepID=A0A1A9Z957_GLOPL
MGTKSPGGPQRCRLILKQCLSIQLTKPGHAPEDFWMYDSGYMIFQNFLAANAQCWWNGPLTAATRGLKYAGHVAPGMLLITGEPCALEVIRGAYARSVLKAPATYLINSVGDIEDCIVTPIIQGQFTPLHEAICDVIMDLTTVGHSATIENVRKHLEVSFPHMTTPSVEVVYDTLAQLMQEQKIYQTAKGYFILTPERRRSRSRPRSHHNGCTDLDESLNNGPQEVRTILMTNVEALHSLYGEISTERDGDLTHQCIQTNLADVICGGNSNDKILYPRTSKRRSSSFPTPRSLERRHSLRLFGSSKRLQRCSSTRSLSKAYAQTLHNTDSSSSEYQSTDSSSPKKGSLLSRLFRRSGRNKSRQLETYSAQFPPVEWFNSKAVHLHSVGTQTADHDLPTIRTLSNSTFYDGLELSQRSLTLPRRHRRQLSSESTFLISSRDCSPIRRRSPVYSSSSLPRSTQSIPAIANNSTKGAITNTTNSFSARLSNPYKCPNSQKSGQISRHILEHSPSRSTNSSKMVISSNKYQDNKCEQRNLASGPSSLESGKTSTFNSGPSSIESSKASFNNKTSGHSSLDSQRSNSSTTIQPKHQTRSIIMLNGSPRGTPRHQIMRARNAEQASSFNHQPAKPATTPTISNLSANASTTSFTLTPDRTHTLENYESSSAPISNSTSNNSITLKVTTSNDNQNSLPNTKIVVQNTPAQSVITFENSQLTENSSVFIINNETTTNERGEVLRKTLSKHPNPLDTAASTKTSQSVIDQFADNERIQSTNYKTRSSILKENYLKDQYNYNVPDTFDISAVTSSNRSTVQQKLATTKSLYNETTMNNSRKLSVPSTLLTNNSNRLVYKNNVLRGDGSQTVSSNDEKGHDDKPNVEISGSMGNLRFFEKNSRDGLTKAINSNCELNNLRYESTIPSLPAKPTKLNSNSSLSGNNLVHILQKNSIGIGSEPNLSQKDNNCVLTADEKSIKKESLNRRFSITKEPSTEEGTDELCNFPSLTDLSFNFTSLAAQKILQGVSLNSIDTLVELNMAAAAAAASVNTTIEKSQNNQNTVCTDYGLV